MWKRSDFRLYVLHFRGLLYVIMLTIIPVAVSGQESLKSRFDVKDFETARKCGSCHPGTYQQWSQAMMSQAYTHHWDEIEYFDLAVAHAAARPELKDAVDGCNGCHTPLAFMGGREFPPPRPSEKSIANESVSCEACHLIKSAATDPAYNFSYVVEPGTTKYAVREPAVESPAHKIVTNDFYKTTEFCGNCHNEQSPYGVWVKSTQLEWMEGPMQRKVSGAKTAICPKEDRT